MKDIVNYKHGHRTGGTKSRTYRIWSAMKYRCKSDGRYKKLYKDKGIVVCDRWSSFENFLADMGEAQDGMTIERIDGKAGYEPGNCRWATQAEQTRNRSDSRLITYRGVTLIQADWAAILGVNDSVIQHHVQKMNRDVGFLLEYCGIPEEVVLELWP